MVDKGEIKVDKDGNITDKNGKKVEVKDGKVEVKTDDGKTVTVKVDDVKATVSNKNNSNKGNTEKKEDTKSNTSSKKDNSSKTNTSDNDKKPAKPSNSSSNNQKPAKPSESSKTETTAAKKYKYYKHHDAVTKFHDREWIVTGTHEEDVYDYDWVNVCNDCGMQLPDSNTLLDHLEWEADHGGKGSYHAEKQKIKVGTKTVEDGHWREAYTETITPAYDEEVSENDHWDKKVLIN